MSDLPVGIRLTLSGVVEEQSMGEGASGSYPRAFIRDEMDGDLLWGTLPAPLSDWPGSMVGTRLRFRAVLVHTTGPDYLLPRLHYTHPTKVEILTPPPALPTGTPVFRSTWHHEGPGGPGLYVESGFVEDTYDETRRLCVRLRDGKPVRLDPSWTVENPHA